MNNKKLYLKPNVVIEPLVDRWYAWAHLISPATASRNIVKRHLKIINSYIQAPHIHAAAVKNPKMLGGPFMDIDNGRLDDVKTLREETLSKQEDLIAFSKALDELEEVLKAHENGYSLESAYDKVPDILKGYVELIYDLNNNPSYRFFEPLLYNSKYYKPESQSIALWVTENDERPFCLSTPRLESENVLHLNIPFSHEGIDELSKMKRTANSLENI
ncbi:MAG: MBL fold metallo-hydrolase, partial [Bacteroidota bacterium]